MAEPWVILFSKVFPIAYKNKNMVWVRLVRNVRPLLSPTE